MTTSTARPTTNPTSAPTTPPDLRPLLNQGIDLLIELATQVDPDQLGLPTPCEDFTVHQLLCHIHGALSRIRKISERQPVQGMLSDTVIDPATIAADIATIGHSASDGWSDDALMAEMVTVPFGTVPAPIAAAAYANEVLVHAWDLATSIGARPVWPADQQMQVLHTIFQKALPAETRDDSVPFGPVAEIADDASPIERLAAWSGRTLVSPK